MSVASQFPYNDTLPDDKESYGQCRRVTNELQSWWQKMRKKENENRKMVHVTSRDWL